MLRTILRMPGKGPDLTNADSALASGLQRKVDPRGHPEVHALISQGSALSTIECGLCGQKQW